MTDLRKFSRPGEKVNDNQDVRADEGVGRPTGEEVGSACSEESWDAYLDNWEELYEMENELPQVRSCMGVRSINFREAVHH